MRVSREDAEAVAALALPKGAVVTGDAAFCRRALCEAICDGGGDYLFTVTANQPDSMSDIAASFGDAFPPELNAAMGNALPQVPAAPPPDIEYAETVEKGHGRIETRHLALSREVAPHPCRPGAARVCRIERTRERAGPEALLTLVREHWGH